VLVSSHWAVGPFEHISVSRRTALRVKRENGPGVEGFHPTVADAKCNVALSVAVDAGVAWARLPRASFALGIRTVGATRHSYLGVFRCSVRHRDAGHRTGICRHVPDRHAGRIVVKFTLARV
jgi:hypothetical protein